RSRLSGRPSWRTSSVRSSGLGPNWSPSSLVARSPGAKNGKSDMSSYLRDTTLAIEICHFVFAKQVDIVCNIVK
ncbi:MAG: hypothetical protein KGI30_11320, partial [Planctomycetota bacterium]|nr:hypothetical protein [Planctomycetota bacterium]